MAKSIIQRMREAEVHSWSIQNATAWRIRKDSWTSGDGVERSVEEWRVQNTNGYSVTVYVRRANNDITAHMSARLRGRYWNASFPVREFPTEVSVRRLGVAFLERIERAAKGATRDDA